ncbi:ATP-binding cassette domain-containing protein, partial [Siccationidurans ginsengisoli]
RLIANQNEVQSLDAEAYLFSLLPTKMIEMVAIIGVLTIFLYAIFFPSASTNLIALVGLFAAAAYRLMPSMNRILTALVQLKQFQYTIESLESYREAKYNESPHPQQLPLSFNKSIAFDNLCFSFPGEQKPTLRNVNIAIRKGEKIGFIGSSGSGKTTLMNILLRFYSEQQGAILIDGQPLTPQHLQAWHSIIGYVKQDTFLMEASIQDNITLGDSEVDIKRMHYAIEQASLQSFVTSLPEGLNTFIGERGSKLSGGQRQRIGIARALYKQTEILVLDEATSALDNETEREVNEAINKLSHTDMTILIIAHRITTLRECDRIYELSHGEVIAEHQYEDLIRKIV